MPWLVVKPFYKFCAMVRAKVVLETVACHLSSLREWRCAGGQMAGRRMWDGCRVDIDMSISH